MADQSSSKGDLNNYLKKNFQVFPTKYLFKKDSEHVIVWNGKDVSDFLDLVKTLDKHMIYVYKPSGAEKASENQESSDQPAAIGFANDGFLNIFIIDEDLSQAVGHEVSHASTLSNDHKLSVSELMNQDPEELAREMASFVNANLDYMSPDPFNLQYFFKKFWESKGINVDQNDRNFKSLKDKIELRATSIIKSRS